MRFHLFAFLIEEAITTQSVENRPSESGSNRRMAWHLHDPKIQE